MSLKRFTVNRFTTQRFTVPGFGTGGGSAPAGPTNVNTAIQVLTLVGPAGAEPPPVPNRGTVNR